MICRNCERSWCNHLAYWITSESTPNNDLNDLRKHVSDDLTCLFHGEAVAIRLLTEAKATYPEPNATFSLTKFDGTTIII